MLVGGNGAGKSTFYRLFLKDLGLPFINADVLAKLAYPDDPEGRSRDAAKLAEQMRDDLLLTGQSFVFETVYSHPSKIDFLAKAKAFGYETVMVMIHLQNTELNHARVGQRVSEGGHSVPEDKVDARIPRMLKHVQMSIPLCDQLHVYDNSSSDNPFQRVLTINNCNHKSFDGPLARAVAEFVSISGVPIRHMNPLPDWAEELLIDCA